MVRRNKKIFKVALQKFDLVRKQVRGQFLKLVSFYNKLGTLKIE